MLRAPQLGGIATFGIVLGLLLAGMLPSCGPRSTGTPAAADPDQAREGYAYATAALMLPRATRAFMVTPQGDLANGDWVVRFLASGADGTAPGPRAIAAEEDWLPVLRWKRTSGQVTFQFEAVASAEPAPRDSGLLVSVVVRATNAGGAPAPIRLEVALTPRASHSVFVAPDAPKLAQTVLRWSGKVAGVPAEGWSDAPHRGESVVLEDLLAPGASRELRLLLPTYPSEASLLARWARTPHAVRVEQARRTWKLQMERATQFQLGDQEVERALLAARVVLLACTERRGVVEIPVGNPFQYRDVWLRDGARAIRALTVSGHVETAHALSEGLRLLQWPSGAFLSQRGQLDGTGQALWAMDQAMLRPAVDRARIAAAAGAARTAWRWCERQRAMAVGSGWEFGSLLPLAEPRDNELMRAQLVGNDAWAIAGYAAAARLLDAAGERAGAESVRVTRASYVRDFEAALLRTGSTDVPPGWQPGGRDWGNLAVSVPCGVLAPSHPRMAALARRYWAVRGGAGLGWYGTSDSLHTYLGADLATWALLVHRPASADSVLTEMLQFRTASGGAGEVIARSTRDFGTNVPPHTTAAASLVSLVRDMLVYDEGDTLRLTLGARGRWWSGASVSRAPTRFGMVDLRFERRTDTAHWTWTPVPVWTILTLPPGTRVAAPVTAPLIAGESEWEVLAPPGTREATVRVLEASQP